MKPMSPITTILCLILLFLLSFATPSPSHDSITAYEVLEEYDFPVGILPKGVLGYELDSSTGKFSVYLNGSCTFSIDSYELKYKSTVTGVIAKDKISSLSGIKVKVLFLWLSIVSVTREDDELAFSVGIASADFPVSNFTESPTCGCGFDCATSGEGIRKINKPLISDILYSS
ncbi:uncharacterized protein At5g01610-like [Juglans microcarpa x Juglans regia]|uniref:uncharacterized protein At5g01610-like n=1 Tax=Juglans microcarpa x Juglans regia TaxID=2249226 RepID=UPI001B7F558D|nr:uncharacterized protein At5g01610-like [Juglans microcarpa x Juglans regia]